MEGKRLGLLRMNVETGKVGDASVVGSPLKEVHEWEQSIRYTN